MLGEGLCPATSEYAAPPTEDWGGGGGGGGRASYRGKKKKITLFFTMSLISSQFESERSEKKSRMDRRKKKKTKQTARCISTETSLFMRNKGRRRMRDHLSFGLFPPAVNTRESGLAASVVSSPTSHCNGGSPFLLVCLLLGHRIA